MTCCTRGMQPPVRFPCRAASGLGASPLEGSRTFWILAVAPDCLTEHLVAAGATIDAVCTSNAMLDALDVKINEYDWTDSAHSTDLPNGGRAFALVVCSSVCSFLDDYPSTVEVLVSRWTWRPLRRMDWEPTGDDEHGLTLRPDPPHPHSRGTRRDRRSHRIHHRGERPGHVALHGHGRRPHHEPESREPHGRP